MNDLPIPLSRVDLYLAVAAGMEGVTLPEAPLSRLEQFLAVIAGDTTVELPIPASLTELWLNYVAGGALTSEMKLEGAYWVGAQKVDVRFFAVAGGMEGVTLPEPQNRTEQYWARIAEIRPIHGVLKYATGTSITLTDVVSGITSLENVYGDTFQQTYTGKNLYNSPDRSQTRYGVTAAIANNRVTISGTATRNNFGGTYFNLNGTDNANANYYNYDNTTSGITLAAGTYTLSLNNVTGSYTTPSLVQMFVSAVYSGSYPIPTLATITLTNDQTSATFTIAEQTTVKIQFRVQVSADTSVAVPVFNNYSFDLQLESGSTATTYEPYVGGTASPNPDYPQDVQVVTGTQTVTVSDGVNSQDYTVSLSSKNLFDGNIESGGWGETGNPFASNQRLRSVGSVEVSPNTQYTLSATPLVSGKTVQAYLASYDENGTFISLLPSATFYNTPVTVTTPANCKFLKFTMRYSDNSVLDITNITDIQLEEGSTDTPYTPYYNYELAKIGTYQDYIYKSGDDWYVHKAIGKVTLDGTVGYWNYLVNRTNVTRIGVQSSVLFGDYNTATTATTLYSEYFKGGASYDANTPCAGLYSASVFYMAIPNSIGTTAGSITQEGTLLYWINQTKPSFYLSLKTPTDTKITDSTLIAQLNAINSAVLPKPNAYIEVTASGTNLAGALKISYYGEEE